MQLSDLYTEFQLLPFGLFEIKMMFIEEKFILSGALSMYDLRLNLAT